MSLSHNFCPSVWHFSYLLLWQHWCFFGWPPWVRWLHSKNINILSMWNYEIKVDEVHSEALIYQNLEILSFSVAPVWPIIFHQYTDITTWNKANITGKIFISKIRCLKMFRIYLSGLISNFRKIVHGYGCVELSMGLDHNHISKFHVFCIRMSLFVLDKCFVFNFSFIQY